MKVYSVIVTGSQEFPDLDQVDKVLDDLLEMYGRLRVVHGDAKKGVDKRTDQWVLKFLHTRANTGDLYSQVLVRRYPANWIDEPRSGGMIRNAAMVKAEQYKANQGLAFLHNNSSGTTNCIERLRAAQIPTTIFHSNGRVEELQIDTRLPLF